MVETVRLRRVGGLSLSEPLRFFWVNQYELPVCSSHDPQSCMEIKDRSLMITMHRSKTSPNED